MARPHQCRSEAILVRLKIVFFVHHCKEMGQVLFSIAHCLGTCNVDIASLPSFLTTQKSSMMYIAIRF